MKVYSRLLSYGIAIGSTAIALLLKLWLEPLVSESLGSFFYIAVLVSTWYGGFRPGIVSVILSLLAINYFLISPRYLLGIHQPKDVLQLSIFLVIALAINLLTSSFRKSKQKIQQLSQLLAQENSQQLRMALSAAHMGMWDWDVTTGKITFSSESEQLFGLTVGSFSGSYESFEACLHPEDRQAVGQALQQALHTHGIYQHEYRILWPDGSIHWIEARGHAYYNEAGQPVRMTGTVTVIDQRKQSQILLQQQFEQQRLVTEITQRIRRSLNLQNILQTTVDEVREFLGCDRVIIFQFSPDWSGTVVVESVAANWTAILSSHIQDPCLGENYVKPFQQGLVIAKSDIYNAGINPCHIELLANFQVKANLVVPILDGNELLWGLMIAHHCAAPRQWQALEIDLLRQLATQVSIAIHQSTLFEQLQTELAERKLIETALRQSEQRYRSLVYASAQIVWRTDAQGLAIVPPESWEEWTGQPAIENLGWGWLETVHPEDRDRIAQRWQECYTNHTFYETEGRLRSKEGNYRDFAIRGVPIYDADGKVSEWIGTCTDITERKRAEAALKANQAQLQRQLAEIEIIYQSAPIGLSVLDTNLRFVRINQRLAEINGFSIQEHIGHSVHELLPNLANTAEQLLRPILETGQPLLNVEIIGETPAQPGVQRTWLESFLPLKDGDRIIGISTVCEEITERKQIQEALRESEERYRTLFESIDEGFCVIEILFDENNTPIDYRFLEINPQFEKQTGLKQAVGKTARQLLPNLEKHWFEIYGQVALTGEPLRFEHCSEVMNRCFDVYAFHFGQSSSRKVALVFKDITESKQAEVKLKKAKEELEIRVAQRTAELSRINIELQQSELTLRSFFNSGKMLMGIVELHNNDILHISDNQTAAQFFGTTPEAMQNKFASDLGVPQPILQEWINYYRQAQEIQAPIRFEYPHHSPHGQKWFCATVSPIQASANADLRFSYIVEDITESKQAKEHIEASLQEKEVLLKEIHHRVKNNLSIVSSLLQMQSRRTEDSQANDILRDSQNRIDSIALVHEKLYRSEDLANIDFDQYIPNLTAHLFASYNINSNQIKLTTQIENVVLDIETAIPCGLIINELVSNALKYAFVDRCTGEIQVKFYQENEHHLILIIQDNGIGLPANFDSKKSKTLGMILVQGLVKQLRGSIDINCEQGTKFTISFKKTRV